MIPDNIAADATLIGAELDGLIKRLEATRPFNLGAPGALDCPNAPDALLRLSGQLLNNVGDLAHLGVYPRHTKPYEREVLDFLAALWGAPEDYWGAITPSGTDSNLIALSAARAHLSRFAGRRRQEPVALYFDSAHDSVPITLAKLRIPAVAVRANPFSDAHDLADFHAKVRRYRKHPIIVIATIGTTIAEAVDNVAAIDTILRTLGIEHRWIHADAALSGVPLALNPGEGRPPFGFSIGDIDSISTSGHKFLAVPLVSSALVLREAPDTRHLDYTGTDIMLHTSRSGHAPLWWWWIIRAWGREGLRQRARAAHALADYTYRRLIDEAGAISWLHNAPSFTVVANSPLPTAITNNWHLAPGSRTRVYVVPGVTKRQVDRFIRDVGLCLAGSALATT